MASYWRRLLKHACFRTVADAHQVCPVLQLETALGVFNLEYLVFFFLPGGRGGGGRDPKLVPRRKVLDLLLGEKCPYGGFGPRVFVYRARARG